MSKWRASVSPDMLFLSFWALRTKIIPYHLLNNINNIKITMIIDNLIKKPLIVLHKPQKPRPFNRAIMRNTSKIKLNSTNFIEIRVRKA